MSWTTGPAMSRPMASGRAFLAVCALIFTASTAVTIAWCAAMAAMGGMPMPGGWTMSMAWMRMPTQTWAGAAAAFLAMWVVMMVAMMLPSLVPLLWGYRQAVAGTGEARLGLLTATVGAGYFFVWTLLGMAAYPLGAALAAAGMEVPAIARALHASASQATQATAAAVNEGSGERAENRTPSTLVTKPPLKDRTKLRRAKRSATKRIVGPKNRSRLCHHGVPVSSG